MPLSKQVCNAPNQVSKLLQSKASELYQSLIISRYFVWAIYVWRIYEIDHTIWLGFKANVGKVCVFIICVSFVLVYAYGFTHQNLSVEGYDPHESEFAYSNSISLYSKLPPRIFYSLAAPKTPKLKEQWLFKHTFMMGEMENFSYFFSQKQ